MDLFRESRKSAGSVGRIQDWPAEQRRNLLGGFAVDQKIRIFRWIRQRPMLSVGPFIRCLLWLPIIRADDARWVLRRFCPSTEKKQQGNYLPHH